ncbi:hypothetical protein TSTA_064610 [Talaromyces stipitatus ATCC 10500]|uniref:Uncharacterized protein n=1 Tax=Talaromyces stipitatus (strain ATCC 10500 / CBS 375.48 / QM 6759 / NRRL 1006) TaxID=441959 RepID=B8LSZ9_TALSN|nr:uncharacterized protein TSTA_064610 [Talaromyces stipitatus ATCC 10500]EED22995.1 hypothetical protein TSTA_064610 [Talaromyces stipitatus ATCC 10500]
MSKVELTQRMMVGSSQTPTSSITFFPNSTGHHPHRYSWLARSLKTSCISTGSMRMKILREKAKLCWMNQCCHKSTRVGVYALSHDQNPRPELLEHFLCTLREQSYPAVNEDQHLVVLIFGHGDQMTFGVALGENKPNLHTQDVKRAIKPGTSVTLFTTFGQADKHLNVGGITAAGEEEKSESQPMSSSFGRACGSMIASALLHTSIMTEEEDSWNTADVHNDSTYVSFKHSILSPPQASKRDTSVINETALGCAADRAHRTLLGARKFTDKELDGLHKALRYRLDYLDLANEFPKVMGVTNESFDAYSFDRNHWKRSEEVTKRFSEAFRVLVEKCLVDHPVQGHPWINPSLGLPSYIGTKPR